jgi:C-terminal processing protease CtpA/Prc
MKSMNVLALTACFCTASALAAEPASRADAAQAEAARASADAAKNAAAAAKASASAEKAAAEVEKELMRARERLEEAAREVAQLSAQMAGQDVLRFRTGGSRRAMLGVQIGEAGEKGGVRVAGVSPGGPAATAGVKPGDVIVAVNGQKVADARELSARVRALDPGAKAKVDVEREGKVQTLVVVTREMEPQIVTMLRSRTGERIDGPDVPDLAALAALPDMVDAPLRMAFERVRPWGDLELASVTKDLGRYFGADRGVLVVRAPSNGAMKLRDGDVITAIDGREPQNGAHALRILRSYQPGEKVALAVLRDRKPLKFDVTLPEASAAVRRTPVAPPSPVSPPTASAPATAPAPAAAPAPAPPPSGAAEG